MIPIKSNADLKSHLRGHGRLIETEAITGDVKVNGGGGSSHLNKIWSSPCTYVCTACKETSN